jgi:hypothetical protein
MSNEIPKGPWQITRSGVMVPVRGALLLPTPKDGQQARPAPGRVEGPAMPIAARGGALGVSRTSTRTGPPERIGGDGGGGGNPR